MNRRQKVVSAVIAVSVIGAGWAVNRSRNRGPEVRLEEVGRRNLVALVTASGNVRPRRTVDISSDVSARVAQLLVREGDDVRAGQVLLRLDPTQFQAVFARERAGFSQAQAQASLQEASLLRAQRDHERLVNLNSRDSVLVSPQQLQDAATNVEVARASLDAALHGIEQARASMEEAEETSTRSRGSGNRSGSGGGRFRSYNSEQYRLVRRNNDHRNDNRRERHNEMEEGAENV